MAETPPAKAGPASPPDDNIDLFEIVATLWLSKWLVIAMTIALTAIGGIYVLTAKQFYRAEMVLTPNEQEDSPAIGGQFGSLASIAGINLGATADSTEALATLRSRDFIRDFIEESNLLPVLYEKYWDEDAAHWISEDPDEHPDIRDGVEYFVEELRRVSEDPATGLVTFAIEWTDPELAANWAHDLVFRVNERLRAKDLQNAEQRLAQLNQELAKTNLVETRQAISQLIQKEVQTIAVARTEAEYAFKIIDPAWVPKEPARPQRLIIISLSFLLGGFFGIVLALLSAAVRQRKLASNAIE